MQGHPYAWPAEDLLLTTITRSSCKTCGFFEERLLPFVRVRPPAAKRSQTLDPFFLGKDQP